MKTVKHYVLFALMFVAVSVAAQNDAFGDDVYFSSKKQPAESLKREVATPAKTNPVVVSAAVSSERDVDEYNRRYVRSDDSYIDEPVNDSGMSNQEYTEGEIIQRIVKFHDPSKIIIAGADNVNIYYDGDTYELDFDQPSSSGLSISVNSGYGWNSPWYYPSFGYRSSYFGGWYNSWYYGWYDPWYYGGWYSPWYYSGWYGYYPGYWGGWYRGPYYYGGWYGGGHHYWGGGGSYSSGRNYYSNGRQSNFTGNRSTNRSADYVTRSSSGSSVNGRSSSGGNANSRENITTTRQGSTYRNGTISGDRSTSTRGESTRYNNSSSSTRQNGNGSVSSDTRTRPATPQNSTNNNRSNSSSGSYSNRSSGSSSGSYNSGSSSHSSSSSSGSSSSGSSGGGSRSSSGGGGGRR